MTVDDRREMKLEDEDDVSGHGSEQQHNETVVRDDDVAGHGADFQHNETVVRDHDVAGHGVETQHNETEVRDDDDDDARSRAFQRDGGPGRRRGRSPVGERMPSRHRGAATG